uniref:NADH dehydrogenase subunit 4L n=1 Tax=Coquillettidia nigricans TaxID=1257098 RepID=UPI001EDF1A65|nr:NADH dehydrogenase subunit 4L [Coquillettidia nigricans]UIS24533.1 NADH dehydrogenase subunit 4L [Coquillettidia nigricans]
MMNMMFYFMMMMFLIGGITFIKNHKHLLCMLLSLEFMVLVLFMMVLNYLSYMNNEMYFSMFFLVFCVCEGVLGLSILVSIVRTHGNDYFQSFTILQC